MELDKLQILKGQASAHNHAITITRARMRTGTAEVRASVSTSSQNRLVCPEAMESAILEVESDDADAFSLVHDQVKSKVLNEKVGIMSERLAVECVQDGMTRPIGSCSTPVGLTALSELQRLTTECALVDLALLCTREWNTKALKLILCGNKEGEFKLNVGRGK